MKDLIKHKSKNLAIPLILGAVKERLVEYRFNIDNYDISTGSIDGRRNNLDKVILGLYRKISVKARKEKNVIELEIKWGGLVSACSVSAFQFFIVPMAFLRNLGLEGFIISLIIGSLGVFINLIIFFFIKSRLISRIKRDLQDLDDIQNDRKLSKSKMDGF